MIIKTRPLPNIMADTNRNQCHCRSSVGMVSSKRHVADMVVVAVVSVVNVLAVLLEDKKDI